MVEKSLYSTADFFRDAEPMMRGVAFAADAVKKAYGPKGGMVEIQVPSGQARYTRRGDLIMGAIAPSDEVEARGANMLKLAAGPAIGNFGDGVITTTILSEYILREGEKNVAAGANPFYLQHGIDLAVRAATGHLGQHAQRSLTPDQIISIGAIAADNDWELGTWIGRMINDGTAPADIRLVKTLRPATEVYDPYTLYVGPTPEIDVEERFVRAQTALHSLGGAFEEGVVAGGGAALLHAADALNGFRGINKDEMLGVEIVRRALEEPARQLAISAGIEPDPIASRLMNQYNTRTGYDVLTGKIVDMYDAGIIDPLKVVRTALNRAGEVACTYFTTPGVLRSGPEQMRGYQQSNPLFASVFPDMFQTFGEDTYSFGPTPGATGGHADAMSADGASRGVTPAPTATDVSPPIGDPKPEAPQQPNRYLVGNFPERVRKDGVAELTVRVSYTVAVGRSGKLDLQIPPEGVTLDILVIASAFEFEGPQQASLFVPPVGESSLVGFRLKGVEEGETQVHVSAIHLGTKVADLTLRVTVGATAEQDPPSGSVMRKFGSVVSKQGDVSIFVNIHKPSATYMFQWVDEDGPQCPVYAEKVFTELSEVIRQTAGEIEEIARLDYNFDLEGAKQKLKTQGIGLWELLPEKIRDRLISRYDKITRITVYSDGDPFPWEMFHPFRREPYFDAEQFLVERVEICRWVHGSKPPIIIPVSRVDFVVDPSQLAKAGTEVAKVTDILTKWNTVLRNNKIEAANELYDLFKQAIVSLLHFACHQSFDGNNERIFLRNFPVAPKDFISFRLVADAAAFIFMNACRSDGKVPGYTKMGGWANTFLGTGAGAFIGTLWEVRDNTAEIFAEALYRELFERDKPFGEALKCARSCVKEKAPGDPTWLAYSFYGDTDARVQKI